MSDLIPDQGKIELATICIAVGGVLVKWIPASLKWLTGTLDKDHNDKFDVMNKWLEQMSQDVTQARKESRDAIQMVRDCEKKHDETLQAMYDDRIKSEIAMSALKAQIKDIGGA